jgi:hypothetical protein
MKKITAVILAVALGFVLVYPAAVQAGPHYYGPPAHGYSHNHGSYYNGWWVAGAAVGGVILGTVIGSAIASPRYAPAPVYAYPGQAYGAGYQSEAPPGEWVTVPGRWVNGQWVPAHRAWVPVNPY